jgi:hypothetical protein
MCLTKINSEFLDRKCTNNAPYITFNSGASANDRVGGLLFFAWFADGSDSSSGETIVPSAACLAALLARRSSRACCLCPLLLRAFLPTASANKPVRNVTFFFLLDFALAEAPERDVFPFDCFPFFLDFLDFFADVRGSSKSSSEQSIRAGSASPLAIPCRCQKRRKLFHPDHIRLEPGPVFFFREESSFFRK